MFLIDLQNLSARRQASGRAERHYGLQLLRCNAIKITLCDSTMQRVFPNQPRGCRVKGNEYRSSSNKRFVNKQIMHTGSALRSTPPVVSCHTTHAKGPKNEFILHSFRYYPAAAYRSNCSSAAGSHVSREQSAGLFNCRRLGKLMRKYNGSDLWPT